MRQRCTWFALLCLAAVWIPGLLQAQPTVEPVLFPPSKVEQGPPVALTQVLYPAVLNIGGSAVSALPVEKASAYDLCARLHSEFKAFWPPDVEEVIPLPEYKAVLVKARTNEAITQFMPLVKLADSWYHAAAHGKQPVLKLVGIRNREDLLLDPANPGGLFGALKAFWPDGIIEVVPLPDLHTLFVKARDEEAIDCLEQLVKILDQPRRQFVLQLAIVRMAHSDVRALAARVSTQQSDPDIAERQPVADVLSQMVAVGKARVIAAPRVLIMDGGEACFSLSAAGLPIEAVRIHATVHPDHGVSPIFEPGHKGWDTTELAVHPDSGVTLMLEPVSKSPSPMGLPSRVRVFTGETMLIASVDAPPAGGEKPTDGAEILTFVTACKLATPTELAYPFTAPAALPPR